MKTRNQFVSVVLMLALLCPMLTFMLPLGANAASTVDVGESTDSFSLNLNEEWNFDDMTAGDILTSGYISSRANGNFTTMTKSPNETAVKPENWVAVADQDKGGCYISAANAYIGFEDAAEILLRDTYEISWEMKVTSCGSATSLLWWADGETVSSRRTLLRLNTDGTLGYTVSDSYTSQKWSATKITIGEDASWHNFRARISPLDGRMWLWLDGALILNGVVNEYLRDNAANSEYSRIGIMYAWTGSNIHFCVDDIKISSVQIDEYIDFEPGEFAFDENINFENITEGNVTEDVFTTTNLYGTYGTASEKYSSSFSVTKDPLDNSNQALYVKNKIFYLKFKQNANAYAQINLSFDVLFEGIGGWTTLLAVNNAASNNAYINLLRVKNDTNQFGYFAPGGSDTWLKKSDGSNFTVKEEADGVGTAIWYTIELAMTTRTGRTVLNVKDRTTGELLATATFTHAQIKTVFEAGVPYVFRFHNCWNDGFKSYFDNIKITALPDAEAVVDSKWKDPSFDMIAPVIDGMANDDWEITTDTRLIAPSAFWDFEDGKDFGTQNNIVSAAMSNFTVGTVSGSNTTKVMKSTEGAENAETGILTFPGTINDYETIKISAKFRVDHADNYLNVFRITKADGGTFNCFRIGMLQGEATQALIGVGGLNPSSEANSSATVNKGEWNDLSITIVPATGQVIFKIADQEIYHSRSEIRALRDENKPFVCRIHHYSVGSGNDAISFIDDVKVETTYSQSYYDRLGCSPDNSDNNFIKTLPDTDGNARAILTLEDKDMYLTKQPFELSFDYMMNQKPSDTINLVRFNMNGTAVSLVRLQSGGGLYNYTSPGYLTYHDGAEIPSSGKDIPFNAIESSQNLTEGIWYNIRVVMDPVSGSVKVYLDNVLVSDYNINDVYIDANGQPLGVTKNATQMIFEIGSQWSKDIKINDFCIDNLRIRTFKSTANYIGYQTTVIQNKIVDNVEKTVFDLRIISGVDSLKYNFAGYNITVIYEKDGETHESTRELRTNLVYESIYEGNKWTPASELGAKYLIAIAIGDIDADCDRIEFVIKPYTSKNGINNYGDATILVWTGASDVEGYPVFDYIEQDVYNLNTWLVPYWEGNIMYNESCLMIGDEGVPLMYEPKQIISVRSCDLRTTYVEGVDYKIEDGKIYRLEGSSMPYYDEAEYYLTSADTAVTGSAVECKDGTYILSAPSAVFQQNSVFVTYTHAKNTKYIVPETSTKLNKFIEKLEAGEEVNVVFFGDSITDGSNATGRENVAPYMPRWTEMVTAALRGKYPKAVINYTNTAVGGKNVSWGVENYETSVNAYSPDLLVLGFGMNDINTSVENFILRTKTIVDGVLAANPDCEIVLIGSMLPNEIWKWYGNQYLFEDALIGLAESYDNVDVAKMTSVHRSLLTGKRFVDMTSNNGNHPNDFLIRVYAQTILKLLVG